MQVGRRSEARRRLMTAAGLALAWAGAVWADDDAPAATAPLVVKGKAPAAVPLLTQPIAATPQSITVLPAEVIQLAGLTDLRDVLRLDPSVSAHADEDSAQGTNVQIRGFSARFDIYRDGQLDPGGYYRDAFDLAEVEVLTGPSSVLFGRGSTGGVIDDIGKAPTPDALQAAALSRRHGPAGAPHRRSRRAARACRRLPPQRHGPQRGDRRP